MNQMAGVSKSSNDTVDFTDDEIRSELSKLGYDYIDENLLSEFKKDLYELVESDVSQKSFNSSDQTSQTPSSKDLYSSQVGYDREPLEKRTADLYEDPLPTTHYERRPFKQRENIPMQRLTEYRKPQTYSHFARSLPVKPKISELYDDVESVERPSSADGYRRSSFVDETQSDTTCDNFQLYTYQSASKNKPVSRLYLNDEQVEITDADHIRKDSEYYDELNSSKLSQGSVIKRKISTRLPDGQTAVLEQSYRAQPASDSEQSDVDDIEALSHRLQAALKRDKHPFSRPIPASSRPQSARYDRTIDPVKSAVIWPEQRPVQMRGCNKSDPVATFHSYNKQWKKVLVPEDKKHKNLRWAVREQMLYKDIIYEKPRKQYVENKYVVPTEKKRKNLRWRIRADMAAGFLPSGNA